MNKPALPPIGYIADSYRQHVYRDLHPYCCTFEDCTTADRLYDSRRTWFQHELGHRICWQCVEGCNRSFSCEKDFVAHVQALHPDLTAPDVLIALKHSATRSETLSDQGKCPLCNKSMALRVLQKHLGRHQEQLALFALPQNLDETEDDQQDEDSHDTVATMESYQVQIISRRYFNYLFQLPITDLRKKYQIQSSRTPHQFHDPRIWATLELGSASITQPLKQSLRG
jgi:hypothetical protein